MGGNRAALVLNIRSSQLMDARVPVAGPGRVLVGMVCCRVCGSGVYPGRQLPAQQVLEAT
jgi:hypothetical protein